MNALAGRLKRQTVDVLILNAGTSENVPLSNLDFTSIRRQFEVNALGPLRVVRALMPNLRKGSKIAMITSRTGSIADNASSGHSGYPMSKAAANMAGVSLAQDRKSRGVAVIKQHPGFVRTQLTGGRGDCDPPVAARAGWGYFNPF